MSDSNKQVSRRFTEWFSSGDARLADEILSPDVVFHGTSGDGELRGIEALKAFVADYRRAFPDARSTVEDQIGRYRQLAEAGVQTAILSMPNVSAAAVERFAAVISAFPDDGEPGFDHLPRGRVTRLAQRIHGTWQQHGLHVSRSERSDLGGARLFQMICCRCS